MSTPKPNTVNKKLWENCISPITVHEPYSDSDQSSNDDFKSARSDVSKKSASETHIKNAKSLGYLPNQTVNHKSNIRSVNTVTSTRNLQSMANTFRGSYTNLRTAVNGYSGSQSNLNKISSNLKGSQSNLKTVGSVLRGSYTSLRPISSVSLPVAPPITKSHSNPTTTRPLNTNNTTRIISSHTKVAEVPPIPRETSSGDHHFVKPAPPKTSGLPRPVGTGIPRPVSRIPGPRAARPSSLYQTRHASEGYY